MLLQIPAHTNTRIQTFTDHDMLIDSSVQNPFIETLPWQGIQPLSPPKITYLTESGSADLASHHIDNLVNGNLAHVIPHQSICMFNPDHAEFIQVRKPTKACAVQSGTKVIDDLVMIAQFDGYCVVIVRNCFDNTRHI